MLIRTLGRFRPWFPGSPGFRWIAILILASIVVVPRQSPATGCCVVSYCTGTCGASGTCDNLNCTPSVCTDLSPSACQSEGGFCGSNQIPNAPCATRTMTYYDNCDNLCQAQTIIDGCPAGGGTEGKTPGAADAIPSNGCGSSDAARILKSANSGPGGGFQYTRISVWIKNPTKQAQTVLMSITFTDPLSKKKNTLSTTGTVPAAKVVIVNGRKILKPGYAFFILAPIDVKTEAEALKNNKYTVGDDSTYKVALTKESKAAPAAYVPAGATAPLIKVIQIVPK